MFVVRARRHSSTFGYDRAVAGEAGRSTIFLGSAGGAEAPPSRVRWLLDRYGPRPQPYRGLWRRRLGAWLMDLNREAMDSATWMGIPAAKNPLDAWIYQEIIHETRPERIVELGSAYGGGTLMLAHFLDLLGGEGTVVSVDISREAYRADHPRIVSFTGSSTDPEVIELVRAACGRRRTMVIHDASHRAAQVLADLQAYAPMVTPGCFLIVEDGLVDVMPPRWIGSYPGHGPYRAVEAFIASDPPFDIDRRRERFLATNNPCGFLRRRDA